MLCRSSPTGTRTTIAAARSSRSPAREPVPRETVEVLPLGWPSFGGEAVPRGTVLPIRHDRGRVTGSSFTAQLEAELAALSAIDRRRSCPEASGASRVHPDLRGRPMLSFCSNDYLGLASHPALAAAAADAAARDGSGASASRLVVGDLPAHRRLESALAAYLDRPAALTFPSGYQANLGVLTALAGRDDLIVSDALNHASLVDGCRLSRARVAIYPHGDARAAHRLLSAGGRFRRRLLVTESLFSMDGDAAPLALLAQAAAATDSVLVVDEAHAYGVLGPGGRGLCAAASVAP